LGTQAPNFSDEQLREILEKRQRHFLQSQGKTPIQSFMPQVLNQGQPPQHPSAQHHRTSAPLAQQQMIQHIPQPQPPQASASQAHAPVGNNVSRPSNVKQAPKNLKRPNSDDVVEVQNPNLQQQPQAPRAQASTTQAKFKPGLPQATREQLSAMTPHHRAQLEAHLRTRQQAQTRQPITKAVAEESWNHLPDHIKQPYSELSQNAAAAQPVVLTPEQTASMSQQLRDNTDMLGRMDALVQWVAKLPGQEKNFKNLLHIVSCYSIHLHLITFVLEVC
jgi:hypothetical protein